MSAFGFLKRRNADMTSGSIWRQLVDFSVPMLVGLLFQQLYNTVDSVVVGQFVGKEALAAVGSVAPILNTLIGTFSGLSTGAGVVISQRFGAKDELGIQKSVHTSLVLMAVLSIFMAILGVAIVNPMLRLMDTPEDVFADAATYLRINFLGVSGLMIYNMGAGILRAVGDSQRPLYFLIFSSVTNIVLDLAFVVWFKMAVAGVALATILSQILSAILVIWVLSRPGQSYSLHRRALRIDKTSFLEIWRIGLPTALQMCITSFSNVFVQGYVNVFGSDCMAGWSCYNKLDAILFIPMQSLAMAATTFVGQNFGAGNMQRAKRGTLIATGLSLLATVLLVIPMEIFTPACVRLFNSQAEVLDWGVYFIRIISPFTLCACFNQVFSGSLRGVGVSRPPMLMMLSSFVVARQVFLFICTRLWPGRWVVAFAYPVGWLLCSLEVILYYFFAHWEKAALQRRQNA